MRIKKTVKKFRQRAAVFAVHGILRAARYLGWRQCTRLGSFLGDLVFLFASNYRRIAIHNLKLVYGETKEKKEIYRIASLAFRNLGSSFLEALKLPEMSPDSIRALVEFEPDSTANLLKTLNSKQSVMIITGHYGNWELFAASLGQMAPLNVLAKENSNAGLEALISETRAKVGIKVINRDDPSVSRALRRVSKKGGEILGVLMDQDTRVKGVFSDFLGHPANTPSGPAAMALKEWFVVYSGFMERLGDGRFRASFEGPLEISRTGKIDDDIQQCTDEFNAVISKQIMKNPNEWAWIHRRWRRKQGDQ